MDTTTDRFKTPTPAGLEEEAQQLSVIATLRALKLPTPTESGLAFPTSDTPQANIGLYCLRLVGAGIGTTRRKKKA